MNFVEAVGSVFRQYVGFSGRARRSEYWFFVLFTVIVSVVLAVLDLAIGNRILSTLVNLAYLLPSLAVSVRRLHDIGRTGWWILIGLVPIVGWILLIVWACQDSAYGSNEYGPSPKPVAGGQAQPYGGYAG